MIFDSHAHYDDTQFDEDRDALLTSMEELGVGTIVNAAADPDGWDRVVELTEKYPQVYGMVGAHPDEVGKMNDQALERMRDLLKLPKMVAVGEIGLDYHWNVESEDLQKDWFIRQLDLARDLEMPVNIHSRDATEDTLEIMRKYQDLSGIIHCFSGSREIAKEYVKMGFLIGVGGVVTFKNGKKLRRVVESTPLESLVLETDCPYLAPEPNRGKKNHSDYIRYVAEAIAHIKEISTEEVIAQTEKNARRLYGIK